MDKIGLITERFNLVSETHLLSISANNSLGGSSENLLFFRLNEAHCEGY